MWGTHQVKLSHGVHRPLQFGWSNDLEPRRIVNAVLTADNRPVRVRHVERCWMCVCCLRRCIAHT